MDEFGCVNVVCDDATYPGCGEDDIIRLFVGKEVSDGALVGKLKLRVGSRDKIGVALFFQARVTAEPTRPRWPAM